MKPFTMYAYEQTQANRGDIRIFVIFTTSGHNIKRHTHKWVWGNDSNHQKSNSVLEMALGIFIIRNIYVCYKRRSCVCGLLLLLLLLMSLLLCYCYCYCHCYNFSFSFHRFVCTLLISDFSLFPPKSFECCLCRKLNVTPICCHEKAFNWK